MNSTPRDLCVSMCAMKRPAYTIKEKGCKGKRLYIFLILNFLYVMRFSMIFNMQLLKNIIKSNKIPKNNEKENSIHFCS